MDVMVDASLCFHPSNIDVHAHPWPSMCAGRLQRLQQAIVQNSLWVKHRAPAFHKTWEGQDSCHASMQKVHKCERGTDTDYAVSRFHELVLKFMFGAWRWVANGPTSRSKVIRFAGFTQLP